MDKEKQTTEIVDEVNAAETSAQAEVTETIDEASVTDIVDGENAAATVGEETAPAKKPGAKKASKIIYWALIAVFATVFIISSITILDYFFGESGTIDHNQMMDDLRDQHQRPSGIVRPTNNIPQSTTLPTDPTNPDEPTVPTDPTDPSDPTVPSDPTQPSDPTVPSDPTQPVNPTEPKPTEPKPTEPTTPPTEPKPTEPVTPTEPQSTEPKPTEPKPTEPKPTEPPKPTVPTQPPYVNTTILSEMKPIYNINNDVVGWIQIPGTKIDYPVLQKKDSPGYYLYRNIYRKDDDHGCIYAEESSDIFTPSDVVTLHGHHMADGTMFQNLYYFLDDNYFKNHRYVYFDSLYTHRTYEVVLMFRTYGEPHNIYPFFPFHTYSNFRNETEFNYFMSSIRKLAQQESNVEVKYGDKLLCLSTCYKTPFFPDGRIVLVCKLIQ